MILIDENIVLINYVEEEDVLEGQVLASEIMVAKDLKAGTYYIQKLDMTVLIPEDMLTAKAKLNYKLPIVDTK
jgi:hypothetical protein